MVVRFLCSISILNFIFVGSVKPQEPAPQILLKAVHCLVGKYFVVPSENGTESFGYILDERSYPNERVLYLVNYAESKREEGVVFAIFLTGEGDHQVFDIQNNAGFKLSKEETSGVSFVTPPLGGIWTQEHLAAAVRQIQKQPRFSLSAKDLLTSDAYGVCRSYTDR